MAYLRYGSGSDWYVFWYSDKAEADDEAGAGCRIPRDDVRLAVWHSRHRDDGPMFTYRQVCSMLDAGDLSQIPGFEPSDEVLLREALAEFVRDVDVEYGAVDSR